MNVKKAYEERFKFWEEQDTEPTKSNIFITPRVAKVIIDKALLEVKDAQLGEELEAVKNWIDQKPKV